MRKLPTILLIAMMNLAVLASSALAQQPVPQSDLLLPPHVERIATKATQLYLGMPEDEVARAMGEPKAVAASESAGVELRVLRNTPERLPIKVTLSDGKVSAVALDIAGIDDPALAAYGRPVWSGMHRTAVLHIMGAPTEDRLRDSFGMKLEHMIFERSGLPDLSIFLIDDRVVTKQAGRALPPDIFHLSLPLAPSDADRATGSQDDQSGRRQIRAGMSVHDVQAMYGEPKMRVPYSVKGRPAEYRIYETASNGQFACFTFIDDVLVGFADGGRFSLDQLSGG
jgi:outer membrane protein assembly factor BamE (lipoprotein component of BamABCDE complex)